MARRRGDEKRQSARPAVCRFKKSGRRRGNRPCPKVSSLVPTYYFLPCTHSRRCQIQSAGDICRSHMLIRTFIPSPFSRQKNLYSRPALQCNPRSPHLTSLPPRSTLHDISWQPRESGFQEQRQFPWTLMMCSSGHRICTTVIYLCSRYMCKLNQHSEGMGN